MMWDSSNPALNNDAFDTYYKDVFGKASDTTSLQGVVNKTVILTGLAVIAGVFGYWLASVNTSILFFDSIITLLITFGLYQVIHSKPERSAMLAPIYAVVEGSFLGALTAVVEFLLLRKGIHVPGGVALQAFIITGSILVAMLALYKARILKPTRMFTAVLGTATAGIMLCYLISWPLALLFHLNLPLISMGAALNDYGGVGLIGLGLNFVILIVAACWLINDFALIEEKISSDSPKYMEWYCGFALLVSLAWIYYESLKLVVRLASLLGSRR